MYFMAPFCNNPLYISLYLNNLSRTIYNDFKIADFFIKFIYTFLIAEYLLIAIQTIIV